MANEITVTQLAGSIPDIVRKTALDARYDAAVILRQVMSVDADVSAKGDRVSLSILPTISINAVGAGGSVTRQQVSLTAVEVVIDTWKEATIDVDDQAARQSALNVVKEMSRQFGEALSEDQDAALAALHSSLTTHTVGDTTNPTPLDDAMVRLARLKLDKASIPRRNRFWILAPDGEADLLSEARFSEAQNTGFTRGLQVEGGRISTLYGDPVFVTNEIKTSGSVRKNLFLHKECLAIGNQKNFRITPLAKVQLSEAVTMDSLYGVKVVRANHGVVVNSATNTDA